MATEESTPGNVTINDLYRAVVDIQTTLAAMNTRLEVSIARHDDQKETVVDHEARIRALEAALPPKTGERLSRLEQFRWRTTGALSLSSGAVGAGATWLTVILTARH